MMGIFIDYTGYNVSVYKFKIFKMKRILIILYVSILVLSCNKNEIESTDAILFNENVSYDELRDIEGNTYKTVVIGDQEWMAQNLRTTTYNDGSEIINLENENDWVADSNGACCMYENEDDQSAVIVYGMLYNWYAIETERLCPKGWHVPSVSEWDELGSFVSGNGGKLKEKGNNHWVFGNTSGTNQTGFSAIPAGKRNDEVGNGEFYGRNGVSHFWSSTELTTLGSVFGNVIVADNPTSAIECELYMNSDVNYDSVFFLSNRPKNYGLSVRCVKD